MAKSDKPAKKKNKIKVNFEGVETRAKIPDGEYHARVGEITVEEGNAAQYLKWVFVLMGEPYEGRKLFYNTSLAAQALWNLKSLLETLGVETPSSETELDLDSYVGLELMLRVENEVFEGKERPKITDFNPVEEAVSTEDDEGKSKGEDDEEEETDDEEESDEEESDEGDEEESDKVSAAEVREMEDGELADLVKLHGLKVDLAKLPKKSKRIAAVIDALKAKDLLESE